MRWLVIEVQFNVLYYTWRWRITGQMESAKRFTNDRNTKKVNPHSSSRLKPLFLTASTMKNELAMTLVKTKTTKIKRNGPKQCCIQFNVSIRISWSRRHWFNRLVIVNDSLFCDDVLSIWSAKWPMWIEVIQLMMTNNPAPANPYICIRMPNVLATFSNVTSSS